MADRGPHCCAASSRFDTFQVLSWISASPHETSLTRFWAPAKVPQPASGTAVDWQSLDSSAEESDRDEGVLASSVIELVAKLEECGRRLGVNVIAYQRRHSGPAHDIARGLRTMKVIKKGDRSTSVESAINYKRHARGAPEWSKLTEH